MDNLRTIRNILFRAWLINLAVVTACWGFVMTDLMGYFMWAMPGMTFDMANMYAMWLIGAADIAGAVLFLVPAIAINWHMPAKDPAARPAAKPVAKPAARGAKKTAPAKKHR